jgi:hypothetical protein
MEVAFELPGSVLAVFQVVEKEPGVWAKAAAGAQAQQSKRKSPNLRKETFIPIVYTIIKPSFAGEGGRCACWS